MAWVFYAGFGYLLLFKDRGTKAAFIAAVRREQKILHDLQDTQQLGSDVTRVQANADVRPLQANTLI